ncbi:MAG: LysM peptidoglycan-binding domain-containing protein [Acidimicrobiia bacterium]
MRRRLGLVIVLGALIGATIVLHRLAAAFPISALSEGPLEVALGSAARLAGLAIAYWLMASTLLYVLASLARLPTALRAISPFTWRPLRRLIDGGLASTMAIVMALPTQASVAPGYVPVPASDPVLGRPTTTVVVETTTPSWTSPAISPPVDILYLPIEPVPPAAVATAALPRSVESEHVVVMPGDNMWLLAERRLSDLLGRSAGDHEVAPYWLAVIGANKDRIRSGDPDLIFPGEVLVLPAWELD